MWRVSNLPSPSLVHFHSLHAEAGGGGLAGILVYTLVLEWKQHEEGNLNTYGGNARWCAKWGNY